MVKLVIFDWDGTLFDSIDKICLSMLEAGLNVGAPLKTKDDIKNIIGLSLDKAVHTVWPECSPQTQNDIIEHYKTLYVASDQVPPLAYPGVMNVLDKLHAAGVKMAVATGKSRRGLNRVMSLTNTNNYFLTSRCADEAVSKPDPLMLNQILAELDILPEHAIMIGDTEYDLNMATNAGMKSIGVTYGAHQEERLRACQPHAIINDFNQLSNILGL